MSRFGEQFDLSLGFDACCNCGVKLGQQPVTCPSCRRVSYCSEACREQDANAACNASTVVEEFEKETALGHTSVICALIKICNDDEAVEDDKADSLDAKRRQAAQDRIQSEFESYPATLANVMSESPCFGDMLNQASCDKELTVHVIGASTDSELWNYPEQHTKDECISAYTEALADLCESRGLDTIKLYFIGPECPDENVSESRSMQISDKVVGELIIQSHKGLYDESLLATANIPKPNIVVLFNPGLTVPDYDWKETLSSISKGTPFILTTNTELEGIADCQYLLDQDLIQTMPPGLADIFDLYSSPDDDEISPDPGSSYFGVNPFAGLRVRQSGTMANDLYVKNRWMLNGILDSFDPTKAQQSSSSKKQRTVEPNNKIGNPALI
jgi:hypothetical protein